MTRSSMVFGLMLLLSANVNGAESISLDELIARHTSARGGAEAIESVRGIVIELSIVEPTFQVDGRYVATRDGRMRIDISQHGQHVFTEALDGQRSWSWSPGMTKASDGSEQGTAALRHGVEFPFKLYGLHELRSRGHRLELLGSERLNGIDYYHLELTLDDGFQVQYYVNPDTWLIERERVLRALHVDVDPTPQGIETVFSDYRSVDGVRFPYLQVERRIDTGELLVTSTVNSIHVNPVLEPAHFAAP